VQGALSFFFLHIFGDADEMCLRLLVDTYRIPDDAVPELVTGFERLLTALVEHDVALIDLPTVTGIRPLQGIRGLPPESLDTQKPTAGSGERWPAKPVVVGGTAGQWVPLAGSLPEIRY
jgi:hypothetical protein